MFIRHSVVQSLNSQALLLIPNSKASCFCFPTHKPCLPTFYKTLCLFKARSRHSLGGVFSSVECNIKPRALVNFPELSRCARESPFKRSFESIFARERLFAVGPMSLKLSSSYVNKHRSYSTMCLRIKAKTFDYHDKKSVFPWKHKKKTSCLHKASLSAVCECVYSQIGSFSFGSADECDFLYMSLN